MNAYRDKSIVVTGGAGAIGGNLSRRLAEENARRVIILDDLSSSHRWNLPRKENIEFWEGSVLDGELLKEIFSQPVDYVFHLAAFFANQNSIDHPQRDLEVNGLGTLNTLRAAQEAGIERFVYASSGCSIYGSFSPLPLKEEFVSLYLSSPYQITKMLGELYCNFFYRHYGLKTVKTRFFNSYGPGEIPGRYRNVIPNFIFWALRKEALPITGSGRETRDFTYVGDIVEGLLKAGLVEGAIGEDINLASGTEVEIIELARLINRLTGNPAGIYHVSRRKWDTKDRLLASIEKAGRLLDYRPRVGFEEGISNNLKWFRQHWDEIRGSADF